MDAGGKAFPRLLDRLQIRFLIQQTGAPEPVVPLDFQILRCHFLEEGLVLAPIRIIGWQIPQNKRQTAKYPAISTALEILDAIGLQWIEESIIAIIQVLGLIVPSYR
jgi:hypothetical protein